MKKISNPFTKANLNQLLPEPKFEGALEGMKGPKPPKQGILDQLRQRKTINPQNQQSPGRMARLKGHLKELVPPAFFPSKSATPAASGTSGSSTTLVAEQVPALPELDFGKPFALDFFAFDRPSDQGKVEPSNSHPAKVDQAEPDQSKPEVVSTKPKRTATYSLFPKIDTNKIDTDGVSEGKLVRKPAVRRKERQLTPSEPIIRASKTEPAPKLEISTANVQPQAAIVEVVTIPAGGTPIDLRHLMDDSPVNTSGAYVFQQK